MKTTLLILLAVATALAAAAAFLGCGACDRSHLAVAGAVFYAAAFAATAVWGVTRPIAGALFAAFGFHAGLVASGGACPLCLASAACSLAIAGPLLRGHASLLAVAPWTAALGLTFAPAPPLPPSPPRVVTVYEQAGCPYCEELRGRVMPEASRGLAVDVRYVPATADIRVTPTIVIGRRLLEGLPPADILRQALTEGLSP